MRIEIPEIAVVALIGVSGSGKSTFAKKHFKPTEVLSSDYFRALISDDENNRHVSAQAFETLYYVANKRLDRGLLTVIDATNTQKDARQEVLKLAKGQNCYAVAIVLDIPEGICRERNKARPDRDFGDSVIRRQSQQLKSSVKGLQREGFRHVYVLKTEEEISEAVITRAPLHCNKKTEAGPFDIIGDVHGCYDELCELFSQLGYVVDKENCYATPPEGRKAVFLGDLCDRGPKNYETLRLAMRMVGDGHAYAVAGNHDQKLLRKLRGADVKMSHGLDKTVNELNGQSEAFISEAKAFLDGLTSHYVFDGGNLVIAHAGLKEKYQGRAGGRVREFTLYGDTNGEIDEYGLPVRLPWANEYRGKATVVYGHTPTVEVESVNHTYCIDTGCVFGGKLTGFRYPERDIVQAPSKMEYYKPSNPLFDKPLDKSGMLDINDVLGQKYIDTRLRRSIKINAENSAAALEVMSRFACDPHWLIYLPPTMSPSEVSTLPEYLEYPTEAFDYYKAKGVGKVVCEEKHMGSRAVIVVCKDQLTASTRFNATEEGIGAIYTRTGRRFFDDIGVEALILARLRDALSASGFWEDFSTSWACLDCEIMPWSQKAQGLLKAQYAPVGISGRVGLDSTVTALEKAILSLNSATGANDEGIDLNDLLKRAQERSASLKLYVDAYRRYCWDVNSIEDCRIAPFHILATEGKTWNNENHIWHMGSIKKYMTSSDPVFIATNHCLIDLLDENSIASGIKWWEGLTSEGGEGMVVKPYSFTATNGNELLQPAIKCRGREYLRIIYGPEYLANGNLDRLKKRSLSKKRNLALNEFALGIEALERFANNEPLYRVHECVFGVLALESEPVDPRL